PVHTRTVPLGQRIPSPCDYEYAPVASYSGGASGAGAAPAAATTAATQATFTAGASGRSIVGRSAATAGAAFSAIASGAIRAVLASARRPPGSAACCLILPTPSACGATCRCSWTCGSHSAASAATCTSEKRTTSIETRWSGTLAATAGSSVFSETSTAIC